MKWILVRITILLVLGVLSVYSAATAQQPLVISPLVEKKVSTLPEGELFWRVETLPTREQAEAAAGTWALVAEAADKIWLFTLGPAGGASAGGTKVGEVGPIPPITAPEYLLRINEASGPPGSVTPVHMHPGSEAYFVLAGQQSIRSIHGVQVVQAGQPEAGHGPGMAMQVSSSGSTDLRSLVMFVVDATQPFSSPTTFR